MPNWVYNQVVVKGKKQDVINFLNDGLKGLGKGKEISANLCADEIVNHLNSINSDNKKRKKGKRYLTLRSWMPSPKTFLKWDTTNSKYDFAAWKEFVRGESWSKPSQFIINKCKKMSEDELKAAYEKYSNGYDKAVIFQKEKYGVVGWYDYNLLTLGTKWNSEFDDYSKIELTNEDEIAILMKCDTAWNLPHNWLFSIQEKYKDITLFCFTREESNEFSGYFSIKDNTWVEGGDEFYKEAEKIVKEEYAEKGIVIKDNDEDDYYIRINEVLDDKCSELYSNFIEYVKNN